MTINHSGSVPPGGGDSPKKGACERLVHKIVLVVAGSVAAVVTNRFISDLEWVVTSVADAALSWLMTAPRPTSLVLLNLAVAIGVCLGLHLSRRASTDIKNWSKFGVAFYVLYNYHVINSGSAALSRPCLALSLSEGAYASMTVNAFAHAMSRRAGFARLRVRAPSGVLGFSAAVGAFVTVLMATDPESARAISTAVSIAGAAGAIALWWSTRLSTVATLLLWLYVAGLCLRPMWLLHASAHPVGHVFYWLSMVLKACLLFEGPPRPPASANASRFLATPTATRAGRST